MRIERNIAVTTRDGSPLMVDVFRPDGDAPVPAIASMSPYGKDAAWPPPAEAYP